MLTRSRRSRRGVAEYTDTIIVVLYYMTRSRGVAEYTDTIIVVLYYMTRSRGVPEASEDMA
jgi:hypothetical protein